MSSYSHSQMTWRIDDLARTAGLTVDTVRYYQREGLLPPPRREGRHVLYGPEHLARLERVRELQEKRFSLAAIRSLLDADRPELAEIFGGSEAAYTFDDLIERSGIDRALAEALGRAQVLRDPHDFGRDSYDHEDLDLCRAVAEVARLGLSPETIVELGRIYTEGVESMQRKVVELFADQAHALGAADRRAFREHYEEQAPNLLPPMQRIVGYVHHRTIQRLALAAIARATPDP